jgi:predicted O-methyltransferase YrrM
VQRIRLKLQPSLQTLHQLAVVENGRRGFDFSLHDADKTNQFAYYEKQLLLIHRLSVTHSLMP